VVSEPAKYERLSDNQTKKKLAGVFLWILTCAFAIKKYPLDVAVSEVSLSVIKQSHFEFEFHRQSPNGN
jgi:hypothetical protein